MATKPLSDPWFEAYFFYGAREDGGFHAGHPHDVAFSESQGLVLWCPCGANDPRYPLEGGRPHAILIPFKNPPSGILVPESFGPEAADGSYRPRWVVGGSGIHDLTLTPSVDVLGGKGEKSCWHGWIKNGQVSDIL